jgi:hypothetical protein
MTEQDHYSNARPRIDQLAIETLAQEAAERGDRDAYRELLQMTLAQLHAEIGENRRLRQSLDRLREELRSLRVQRPRSYVTAAVAQATSGRAA